MRVRISSIAAALLAAVLIACGESKPRWRPHVILIVVDALRADVVGANGSNLGATPNLDRLAADGANFSSAFAHSTWTKPSIATLMTSLYPFQHGVTDVAVERGEDAELHTQVLPHAVTTLAEVFEAHGYRTGAVLNQVHLQDAFGFSQGFEHFENHRGMGAYRLNERFVQWLEGRDERPLFGYLHYLDPHWPYDRARRGTRGAFGPVGMARRPPRRADRVKRWQEDLTDKELAALRARYYDEVAFVDEAIGQIVRQLRDRQLWEDTILVVTSDHGESFLEHGQLQHGGAPFAEVVHVPWLVRLPEPVEVASPAVWPESVGLIDVYPTLVEWAGLERPSGLQGRSLVPALRGDPLPSRAVFSQAGEGWAARGGRYTVMRFADGTEASFDRSEDPAELAPLERCPECARLWGGLEEFAAWADRFTPSDATLLAPLSVEDQARLRALGYL